MKFFLIFVGKTNDAHINALLSNYIERIKHYMPIEVTTTQDLRNTKNMSMNEVRDKEGEMILKQLKDDDVLVLLDDKGKEFTSIDFARWIEAKASQSTKRLVFVVGGAYGFSRSVYDRASGYISLSKMTFSHQIIRPIFAEQLYRAMTIIRNEPYHHEDSLFA